MALSSLVDATDVTIEGLDVQMGSDGTNDDVSAQLSNLLKYILMHRWARV